MTAPTVESVADTPTVRCSFCGKAKDAVRRLVASAAETVRICNECVEHSAKIIERADFHEAPPLSDDLEELLSDTLDAYCEGSRRAEGALRDRLFDMEADAERLDWLESQLLNADLDDRDIPLEFDEESRQWYSADRNTSYKTLREAIDAAREKDQTLLPARSGRASGDPT